MSRYKELMALLCEGLAKETASQIVEGGCLLIDDMPFMIRQGAEEADPAGLYIYAAFGTLPEDERAAALQRLLEINYFVFGRNSPSFALNPQNGQVMLCCRLEMDEASRDVVSALIGELLKYGREWRKGRFLDAERTPRPSPDAAKGKDSVASSLRPQARPAEPATPRAA
jgi:hypothetical protein